MVLDIVILLIGLATLILGGDVLVRGASRMALRFNVSTLVVGLTIVAFSTSAPEMLVSLSAALKGVPDFAMGNVVGSNISNLALVLGVASLIGFIPVNRITTRRDWPVTFAASILLYLFILDGSLVRWEGIVLFSLLITYIVYLIIYTKKDQIKLDVDLPESNEDPFDKFKDLFLIALGGACLYFGSDWFIESAEKLASGLGISERIIGLTVLALGTSLPELITSIVAARKGETDLAMGNLLGSNIFNILSILGVTSIVKTLPVNEAILKGDMIWMLILTFGILPLMVFRKRLGTVSGIILLTFYAVYMYVILS
ncbi:MAG: calcium/sodium antiporter [Roseivirga sp.]